MTLAIRYFLIQLGLFFQTTLAQVSPIYHSKEVTYLDLAEMFKVKPIPSYAQFYSPEGGQSGKLETTGVTFTHGGAISSRIADIVQNSVCTGYMVSQSTSSIGLVCGNRYYLLDSSTYSRSQTALLDQDKNTDKIFRSYSTIMYSMLLLSSKTDNTCIEAHYINTFDSSYKSYDCTEQKSLFRFEDFKFMMQPMVKYINLALLGGLKAILVFDCAEFKFLKSDVEGISSKFYLRKSDLSGGPGSSDSIQLELFKNDQKRSQTTTFFEILNINLNNNQNYLVFFYRLKGDPSLKAIARDIVSTANGFDLGTEELPLKFRIDWMNDKTEEAWTGNRAKFIVKHIEKDLVMIFYIETFEVVVCSINITTNSIGDCNKKPLDLAQHIGNTTDLTIFGVSASKTKDNDTRFFLEVKNVESRKTVMSFSLLRVRDQEFSLYKENEWKILGNLHIINYPDDVRVLRGRTMDTYTAAMKYVRIDFKEYFKNSKISLTFRATTRDEAADHDEERHHSARRNAPSHDRGKHYRRLRQLYQPKAAQSHHPRAALFD